jgi:hypothetical protein
MTAIPPQPFATLDPATLDHRDTIVVQEPFAFVVARDQLPEAARQALHADFPTYRGAGFFPYDPADCGPSIRALIDALLAPPFANAIGAKLGIPGLAGYPTLITICRALNSRHGTVHTDSRSKVATALLYFSDAWTAGSAGCLRLLRDEKDIGSTIVPEVLPLYGTLVAFRRSDNSFHGHLPFEGERPVIQVAWVASEADKLRKTRRGRLSRFVKWVAGKLDTNWGKREM